MPTQFCELIHLFIDLRGRGLSLSTFDLDILNAWEKDGLNVEFIAKTMYEIAYECKEKNQNFPNTLLPISRKLNKILLKMREA